MQKAITKLIASVAFATIAVSAQAQENAVSMTEIKADAANPIIELSLTESVASAPDVATFSTGVQTKAAKARDAIRQNAEKMKAVVAQLKGMGIAEKDIQTSALSMQRDIEYLPTGKQRFKGYIVGNQVTAKLRDLSRLGDVLDALATSGATEFNGPNFSLENADAAKASARDKAWARAMELGTYHARKAGFSGVRVVRVAETLRSYGREQMRSYAVMDAAGAAAEAVSTPVEAGEVTTEATIAVSFAMVK